MLVRYAGRRGRAITRNNRVGRRFVGGGTSESILLLLLYRYQEYNTRPWTRVSPDNKRKKKIRCRKRKAPRVHARHLTTRPPDNNAVPLYVHTHYILCRPSFIFFIHIYFFKDDKSRGFRSLPRLLLGRPLHLPFFFDAISFSSLSPHSLTLSSLSSAPLVPDNGNVYTEIRY